MSYDHEIQELRDSLAAAREKLVEQDEFLNSLMEAPAPYATVIKVLDEKCVLSMGGGKLMEVNRPDTLKMGPGSTVKVVGQTLQILDVVESMGLGTVCTVTSFDEDDSGKAEIEFKGERRVVDCSLLGEVKEGDRLIVDSDGYVAMKNLGSNSTRFQVNEDTGVTWEDVGGLEKAKKAMIEAVELPFRYPDLYDGYGKKQVKGVLLHGPPGCGKTLLAKACATSLAQVHGEAHSSGFIYIKGPEILSKWVGQSESTIRSLFHRAREHKEKHGYPAVLFIDEADALLGKRGQSNASFMSRTIVPQFLSEMDGFDDSAAVVLLSTNRPDTLDPAVVRDGRIDRKIQVPRPDRNAAMDIFKLHLEGKALSKKFSVDKAAEAGVEALFDPAHVLFRVSTTEVTADFTLKHIVNGAMIAGIVDQACANALYRDLEAKAKKPTGVLEEDVTAAVEAVLEQNLGLNQDDELRAFAATLKGDLKAVEAA